MKNLSDIKTIKDILKKHNFKFSHSLGQNFIINDRICPKMAEMSGANKNTSVIEIGPGIGVLTCELAKLSHKVLAIEIDKRLIPILNDTLSDFDNVEILNADILELDIKKIIEEKFSGEEIIICANLPYYITSPIIMKLLESNHKIKSITVMVQKEVGKRLCAGPSNKESSAIGVAVSFYSEPHYLFDVNKNNFEPSPKVDSSVIKLDVKQKANENLLSLKTFFKVVKASFLQRRKTILNSISKNLNISKDELSKILDSCNIPCNYRAENLSLDQFINLSNAIFKEVFKSEEKK